MPLDMRVTTGYAQPQFLLRCMARTHQQESTKTAFDQSTEQDASQAYLMAIIDISCLILLLIDQIHLTSHMTNYLRNSLTNVLIIYNWFAGFCPSRSMDLDGLESQFTGPQAILQMPPALLIVLLHCYCNSNVVHNFRNKRPGGFPLPKG